MRPFDSAYDRDCAETRDTDPGRCRYALVSDHNGPCSIVAEFGSLAEAVDAARTMDTDSAPTELSDWLDYDDRDDTDDAGLLDAADTAGWRVVATAPAGEYWTVLMLVETGTESGEVRS